MEGLLTIRQLEDILQVDRLTLYRMLRAGSLHGFKVGGQWRFAPEDIAGWLQAQRGTAQPAPGSQPPSDILPLPCLQAIQSLVSEMLDVALVTVSDEGIPLTELDPSSPFCQLILSSKRGSSLCQKAWAAQTPRKGIPPLPMHSCHAGLSCVRLPIRVDGREVAALVACQFALGQSRAKDPQVLAEELGLDEAALRAASPAIRQLPEEGFPRLYRLLEKTAETFAKMGEERLELVGRLRRIAQMAEL